MEVTFSSVGAAIVDIFVPTKNGLVPVTVHPQKTDEFNCSKNHAGKTIGRNAGRIRFGSFSLGGPSIKSAKAKITPFTVERMAYHLRNFKLDGRRTNTPIFLCLAIRAPMAKAVFPAMSPFRSPIKSHITVIKSTLYTMPFLIRIRLSI